MKQRTFAVAVVMALAFGMTNAFAQEYVLRLANVIAPTEPTNVVAARLAERVAERTNGRVSIEIYPASQLGGGRDYIEQAYLGAPIIGHTDPGYLAGEYGVPAIAVMGGPFLLFDPSEIPALISSDLIQDLNERLADNGIRVLSWNWFFGTRHIISDRGYPEPADLRNVKIRVAPNPIWTLTFETLGAVGVELEWAEVYGGLQQGVVDAAEAPLSTIFGSRLYEVANTITLTGHFTSVTGMIMGEAYWQVLPADIQEILLEEFDRYGAEMSQMTIDSQGDFRERLEAEGVTFVDANVEAYAEVSAPFYSRFPGWPAGLLDDVNAILGR